MNISRDHTIKVIAATVARDVEKAVVQWLTGGIPPDILGQVGDAEKFDLLITVGPAGPDGKKLGFDVLKLVPILKSLLK